MSPPGKSFERLPKDVIPSLYHVTLQPDLTAFTFKGWEKVTLEVRQTTRRITMNAFDLSVTKAYLVVDGILKAPSEIILNEEDELLELSFPEDISPGQFELNLEFSGHLNDQLRGFYRNKYLSENGEVLYAAGTHFEATGARRAYPCWDEPAIKARFIFTLIVPKDKVVLSNMPAEREEISQESSDLKVVTFQPTPIMSTYLTAFVVGDYDFVEAQTSNGIPVRVFTPPGYKEHGLFALEVATKSLSYYEQYFDIPYGLPKLDLITLSEFPIGAMENWGLVIFRETALLLDPANPSAFRKQIVAIIVTHELSHNWFGNLVTMEWWTDLWLKEGFATWISYQCTDALYPEFNIWKQFIKTDQTRALELDALTNSHPIEFPVQHPGEIDEIFDEISYSKGACLIRMLKSYLGDEAFRKGMKLYLKRHQFSNTTNKDMWVAMSEASGSNIEAMMNTWSKQKGFPLIKVSELIDITSNKRQVCLTQQKFVAQSLTSETKGSNPITEQWLVPFSITSSSSPSVPVVSGLLQGGSVTLKLPNCKPEDWIHANPGQYMFYHVLYQPDSLQRLSLGVKQNSLSPEDKLGLLIDSFALCQSYYVNVVDVLRLCECFLDETDFSVCGKLVSGLGALRPFVQHLTQGNDQQFDVFLCKSLQKMKSSLGWEAAKDESHATKLIREQILTVLGSSGDPNVVQEASRRFSDYCSKQATLSADIKTPVFVTVLTNGDKDVYDKLLEIYDNEDMLEEKNRISRILGLTSNESLIQQTLNFALSDKVRNQDTVATLAGATWTLQGRQLVWKFVQENWQELYRRYSTSTMMSRLIKVITDGVCCAETAKQMENFFKAHQVKNAQRAIQQGLEQIATNVAFIHHQGAALMSFLNDQ